MMMGGFGRFRTCVLGLLAFAGVQNCFGYSVLAHEALVDALWDVKIRGLLLAAYPNSTRDEMKKAHGFAYGGAILQDLGYYPHGSPQFSDFTHYVRTGDFIESLIRQSNDLNELAFSLGALSHYLGDNDGHRYATNVAEPILYPRLAKKYGAAITYEQDPLGHLKTEFGFDVLEVARGNFAPEAYHDFIGFHVSKTVIRKAFRETYGLELEDLFDDFDRSVESFRRAVSKTIPTATRVAWASKQDEILKVDPTATRNRFVYAMNRSSYERYWGKDYDKPTPLDRFLAFVLRLLPKIGPLKALQLKIPNAHVEGLFEDSFSRSAKQYQGKLQDLNSKSLKLENTNYDVGTVTPAGSYKLDDNIHAFWLNLLAEKDFKTVTPSIKAEITAYYYDLNAPIETRKHKKKWKLLLSQLKALKQQQYTTDPGNYQGGAHQAARE